MLSWRRSGTALEDDQYGAIVKLLILTGLRRGEIGGLCWSEIDFDADLIAIPPSRTKNGRPHLVPMAAPVRALLAAQPRRDGHDSVFGTLERWHIDKVALDQRVVEVRGAKAPGWCTICVARSRRHYTTVQHAAAYRRGAARPCRPSGRYRRDLQSEAYRPNVPGRSTAGPSTSCR